MTNINVSTPNDGLGDKLRNAMIICNDNFAELSAISDTFESDILAIQAFLDALETPPFAISDITGLQTALDGLVTLSAYNANNVAINTALSDINVTIDFIISNLAASGVLSQYTIDAYQGTRLSATSSTNGFLIDKSINGSIGYIAKNTNGGNGALASIAVLGEGTDWYSNGISLNYVNSGYYINYLKSCGFLYSDKKTHIIATSIDFRTGPLATATTKMAISAGGTVSIVNQPALDATTDEILGRNASGEVVRISKSSIIAIGTSGTSGTSGVNGATGPAGANGVIGSSGSSGTSGTSGSQGPQGPQGISAGQIYYFNMSSTGSVAGYRSLDTTPLPNGGTYSTTSLSGSQKGALVRQFITEPLGFSIIPGGTQRFHLHFLKPAENDNIEAYVEIRLTDNAGTPIGPTISSNKSLIGWVDAINTVETYVDITLPTTAIDPTSKMTAFIRLDNNDSTAHIVQWHTEGSNDYSYVITSVGVINGTSGTSGVNGTNGANGSNGTSGTSGTNGANGSNGSNGTSGTSGINGTNGAAGANGTNGTSGTSGASGITITQVTGVVLTGASWSLVSGFYEYNHSDAAITSTSVVEVIPDNASISIVNAAAVLPRTDSATASVKLYATNLPTGNITTTINIYK
ncbi:Collagen triple helix repeat [uncultured Caudovirales phage]|uniref:Collagen triple helix repeat n=1 Tax=uncultured Caudovirales phage TaxID=2100421 RepID=A0A6J5N627_9CAUD|nr:Collagen triple helix repeat [uncultured Caudovirales phage]